MQTLGSQPVMPKNLPNQRERERDPPFLAVRDYNEQMIAIVFVRESAG